jgi:DNA-binding transcriptional ArsR family regulator
MNSKTMLTLTDKQLKLIEELGVFYEKTGVHPAAARILSLLMVSDKIELTFEEIYETLNLSKSATSNALNVLINTDKLEYITKPGERRRYFRLRIKNLKEEIHKSLEGIYTFKLLLQKVVNLRTESTGDFNSSLEEVAQFLDFMHNELPRIFQKWESRTA